MKMQKLLLLCVILSGSILQCIGQAELGPGGWVVEDIMKCEDSDQYELLFEVTRNKLNRTHDGFSLYIKCNQDIDEYVGIEIEVYKMVDGGYKYYLYRAESNACTFVESYSKSNLETVLKLAGIDPPQCPIKAGEYKVENFVYDYSELTAECPYGTFEIYVYLTSNGRRVACLKLYALFEQP